MSYDYYKAQGAAGTGPAQGAPGAAAGQAYQQYPQYGDYQSQYYYQAQSPYSGVSSWFAFTDPGYLKGLLLGAGVTLLLTNPTVQKNMVRGAVKLWSGVQYGMEEIKEQIQDMKAELSLKADKEEE